MVSPINGVFKASDNIMYPLVHTQTCFTLNKVNMVLGGKKGVVGIPLGSPQVWLVRTKNYQLLHILARVYVLFLITIRCIYLTHWYHKAGRGNLHLLIPKTGLLTQAGIILFLPLSFYPSKFAICHGPLVQTCSCNFCITQTKHSLSNALCE